MARREAKVEAGRKGNPKESNHSADLINVALCSG